jgi:hypothetical protein
MKTNAVQLMACIAWAAVAVSSASTAHAKLETYQSGPYALCAQNNLRRVHDSCNALFSYEQEIKLSTTSCNQSSCIPWDLIIWSESLYTSGRKVTTAMPSCNAYHLYGLGSCAC